MPISVFITNWSGVFRCTIQMWSSASTSTPMVGPISQWFGRFFGNSGSTSNVGTPSFGSIESAALPPPCSCAPVAATTTSATAASAPANRKCCFRFIEFLP